MNQLIAAALLLIGLVVGGMGLAIGPGGEEEMRSVEVCVATGERPGLFNNCPTVMERRMVEGQSGTVWIAAGGVLTLVGLAFGLDD